MAIKVPAGLLSLLGGTSTRSRDINVILLQKHELTTSPRTPLIREVKYGVQNFLFLKKLLHQGI